MGLPVNIRELINGTTVEWERIEFKKGWNPVSVLHSICAFANDINNWGGGYVILGIDEKEGRPVLPPVGLDITSIDKIQKDLLNLCNQLRPVYFPIVQPVVIQEKHVLIIWVPGGTTSPYKAPVSLGAKKNGVLNEYAYYVRRFSNTVLAKHEDEKELVSMAGTVPFDDRIDQNSSITDLNFTLIKAHLAEIESDLLSEADEIPFVDLCRRMSIVEGPNEFVRPKNVGLLFFNDAPHEFFSQAQIDVVEFKDDAGDRFVEKIFKGPLRHQIVSSLAYINNFLVETVQKVPDRPQAIRYFNYPYVAIEEALVNAVYHKSYEIPEPVEVRIEVDRIEILSFPGPLPPITKDNLMEEIVTSRKYRNRRIGELLKELHLTEGRNTGFRKIRNAMKHNGSPEPIFKTDDDRSYFITILPIHPEAQVEAQVRGPVEAQVEAHDELTESQIKILSECAYNPLSTKEMVQLLGHSTLSGSIKKAISGLMKNNLIAYTIPEIPQSRLQKYQITEAGLSILKQYTGKGEDDN